MTLNGLEHLLDAYGGDAARWPADRRNAALALIASDPAAQRRLDEARALDRVLSRASQPNPERIAALVDQIMAEAAAQPMSATPALKSARTGKSDSTHGNVVALPRPAKAPRETTAQTAPTRRYGSVWQAAATLAGALLLGVAVGYTDLASTTAEGLVAQMTTARSDTEVVLASLQADPILGVLDEDTR
ncbi:MAG: hypothetical protein R3D67_16825 [Hyphomicrobiaceae bacterium]